MLYEDGFIYTIVDFGQPRLFAFGEDGEEGPEGEKPEGPNGEHDDDGEGLGPGPDGEGDPVLEGEGELTPEDGIFLNPNHHFSYSYPRNEVPGRRRRSRLR